MNIFFYYLKIKIKNLYYLLIINLINEMTLQIIIVFIMIVFLLIYYLILFVYC